MILMITALFVEATPVIRHFKLKRDLTDPFYEIYKNRDMALIISGVGKIKSGAATAYLFSFYRTEKNVFLFNIGFCGTADQTIETGSLVAINKVTDYETGRDFYPDSFWIKTLPQKALTCFANPVTQGNFDQTFFCDMESAGFVQVAQKFVFSHQTVLLKIVSDHLLLKKFDKPFLTNLIQSNLLQIETILDQARLLDDQAMQLFTQDEEKSMHEIFKQLRFSSAMGQLLVKEMKKSKRKGLNSLAILASYQDAAPQTKEEGKKIFEQIIKTLS